MKRIDMDNGGKETKNGKSIKSYERKILWKLLSKQTKKINSNEQLYTSMMANGLHLHTNEINFSYK